MSWVRLPLSAPSPLTQHSASPTALWRNWQTRGIQNAVSHGRESSIPSGATTSIQRALHALLPRSSSGRGRLPLTEKNASSTLAGVPTTAHPARSTRRNIDFCPHRLEDQDGAPSRREREFESRWGTTEVHAPRPCTREWRNGRRASLRGWCSQGRAGSSPASRTTRTMNMQPYLPRCEQLPSWPERWRAVAPRAGRGPTRHCRRRPGTRTAYRAAIALSSVRSSVDQSIRFLSERSEVRPLPGAHTTYGSSSIGRAADSRPACWGFKSSLPCQPPARETTPCRDQHRNIESAERGAVR